MYYLVQVDFEYVEDNSGGYTLLKTKAARLRERDIPSLEYYLFYEGVKATLVPTTYKPTGTVFIDPIDWFDYHRKLQWR